MVRRSRLLRLVGTPAFLFLVLTLVDACGAGAAPTATPNRPDKGECVDISGPDDDIEITVVGCGTGQYEVLEVLKLGNLQAECPAGTDTQLERTVQFLKPGQTENPSGGGQFERYCLRDNKEPTPSPTVAATPSPTDATGIIEFGREYDKDTLAITDPRTTFRASVPEIAWTARFSEPAGAPTIRVTVARRSSSGKETVLIDEKVSMSDPSFDLVANTTDLASLLDNKPGVYIMRYVRDGTLLAEGVFELER